MAKIFTLGRIITQWQKVFDHGQTAWTAQADHGQFFSQSQNIPFLVMGHI